MKGSQRAAKGRREAVCRYLQEVGLAIRSPRMCRKYPHCPFPVQGWPEESSPQFEPYVPRNSKSGHQLMMQNT